jgi:hypothetical protein
VVSLYTEVVVRIAGYFNPARPEQDEFPCMIMVLIIPCNDLQGIMKRQWKESRFQVMKSIIPFSDYIKAKVDFTIREKEQPGLRFKV